MKILLVENIKEDINHIECCLYESEEIEFILYRATHLRDALKKLKQDVFDVVLSSITLPDADGAECYERISQIYPELPVVLLTQADDIDFAKRIVKSGAQDYLIKGQGDTVLISRSLRYAIERKKIEVGLSFLSNYDVLTELPNRVHFQKQLEQSLIRANRSNHKVVVLFIGIDRFKEINDGFGLSVGDEILHQLSKRLAQLIKETDTIARFGSDEFLLLLESMNDIANAMAIAKKVMAKASEPFFYGDNAIYITLSMGVSLFPHNSKSAQLLITNADAAMNRAKQLGGNRIEFFTQDLHAQSTEKLDLQSKLRTALKNNEFFLHFQPKFSIAEKRLIGAEALIRWKQPELGIVKPDKFISVAEQSGLITQIGEWVIREVARHMQQWQTQGLNLVRLAINLSPRQFHEGDIVDTLMGILSEFAIQPRYLEAEITENMLVHDVETTAQILQRLKMWGMHIAIDDFGTGYSSLRYLKRLPIDTLKIDQSFVRDVITNADDAAIASAIIALGHKLRMTVIAEGIETQEQLDFLKSQGCNEGQGYYYSKPLSADEFYTLLQDCQQQLGYVELAQLKETA